MSFEGKIGSGLEQTESNSEILENAQNILAQFVKNNSDLLKDFDVTNG